MSVLEAALLFLCEFFFTLLIAVLVLRFCLQLSGMPTRNIITQWLGKVTNPVLKPLRFVYLRVWKNFDSAVFLMGLLLVMAKTFLIGWFRIEEALPLWNIFIFSCGQFLQYMVQLYSIAIIAQVVLNWINPAPNAVGEVIYTLTAPMLNWVRKFLPPIAGFDLSPIPVWLCLQLISILIATPLMRGSLWML